MQNLDRMHNSNKAPLNNTNNKIVCSRVSRSIKESRNIQMHLGAVEPPHAEVRLTFGSIPHDKDSKVCSFIREESLSHAVGADLAAQWFVFTFSRKEKVEIKWREPK